MNFPNYLVCCQVAESDIESLRDNLANEKTRLLNLEKELQNLKASCTCIDIRPTETSSAQTYENRGSYASASPQADEPCISESSDEVLEIMFDSAIILQIYVMSGSLDYHVLTFYSCLD